MSPKQKTAFSLWGLWILFQIVISLVALWAPFEWKISFTYQDLGIDFGVPRFIGMRANFDGYHYITIARNGYGAFQHAFFPFFPILLKSVGVLFFNNTLLGGLVLNVIFSGGVVLIWHQIFSHILPKQKVMWATVFFLAFPSSFFLTAVYNEALFLFLLGFYTLFIFHKKMLLAGFVGVLLGLTRSVGIFAPLIPFGALLILGSKNNRFSVPKSHIWPIIAPLIGVVLYMFYLFITTGDLLAFVHAQQGFHNNRSTTLILLPQVYWRYFKILTLARLDVAYMVAFVEVTLFTFAFAILLAYLIRNVQILSVKQQLFDRGEAFGFSLVLFSLANLVYPTLTGTMSSVPRYALVGMGLFFVLAHMNLPKWFCVVFLAMCMLLQGILFALFAHGFFVS